MLSWSYDSRFAVLSNGNGPSVEVIDMRLGTRVATEKLSAIVGAFAPRGYSYFYSSALTPLYAPRYARVTENGSTGVSKAPFVSRAKMLQPSRRSASRRPHRTSTLDGMAWRG